MKPKKVLVMVNDITGGGAERVADTHMRLLTTSGKYEVAAVTCGARPAYLKQENHYPLKNFLTSPTNKVLGALGIKFNHSAMENCLSTFTPEIVHIHAFIHFSPSALRVLADYKKRTGCKIVLTHHTFSFVCPNDALLNYRTGKPCEKCLHSKKIAILRESCYGSRLGSLGKYVQKSQFYHLFADNLIDFHVAPGEFMKGRLLESKPNLSIRVIYNPCLKRVRSEILPKMPNKMVYFGRISREKNVQAIIKTISKLPAKDIKTLIVGDGPESDKLEQSIQQIGADSIQFQRGFVSQETLYPLIADAQFYILPSIWYENSPVAIIEALDLGIVPLVSGHGGMKEMIEWAGVGYQFDPENIDSIVDAIQLALSNKAEDNLLLSGPLRNKLETFTEQHYLDEILTLYSNL